ncbi:hypothetical protein [Treponema sp. Marseille-Q4130]|uniref:hypothetical protein n=1 Tax=Treponema sp. Marseille-Q4130 TaxID=2766702 RepID=UPI001652B65C|nr:hypothetical protein [Treponema sp. Marseille-Q4130]MBC6719221.1 hypothetical protein [Treponema sp. Marseille-Q4130]
MSCCVTKNYYSPQKKRILLLNTAEIRRKTQIRQPYCNLYAYGANNPVHYIDPDGNRLLTIFAYWNMSNYSNQKEHLLGNSSGILINKAGCYIAAFANLVTSAFFKYEANIVRKDVYLTLLGINSDKALFGMTEDTKDELRGHEAMDAIFGNGNWDYWTKSVQGEAGLLGRIKEYNESGSDYMLVGIFNLSEADENVPIHMVGINGLPGQDGIFNVNDIVPSSSGDRKRLSSANQRNAYSLKNLIEIRVVEIKNRYSSLQE